MSTKKIILAIIIVLILFGVILRATFNSIVEVNTDVQLRVMEDKADFDFERQFLDRFYDNELFEDFKLSDSNIIIIDHDLKNILFYDGKAYQVEYSEFPESIRYGNSFYTTINGQPTLVINNDEILGDVRTNIIVEGYKYMKMSVDTLNPKNIEFYNVDNDNIEIRFMRYKMIETLKQVIINNDGLSEFRFYYENWKELYGNGYKDVVNYDLYEGKLKYVEVMVEHMLSHGDTAITEINHEEIDKMILESKNNSTYLKEDEYKLIGMMLFYYAEKNNLELESSLDKFLSSIPIRSVEVDKNDLDLFRNLYAEGIKLVYESVKLVELNQVDYTYQTLTSEYYKHTFLLKDNYYIYSDYVARDKNGDLFTYDYIIVNIEPYRLKYFVVESYK